MNELDTALLDNYFNGLLSAEEQAAVQARLTTDPDFRNEFALRQKMEDWPRQAAARQAVAETISAVGADFFKETLLEAPVPAPLTARMNWQRWMLAVAASAALLVAAILFFQPSDAPGYRQYAQHAPLSLTERSAGDDLAVNAETTFNAQQYAEALGALERLLAVQPTNTTAQLYRGICLLELGRPAEARAAFEPLSTGVSAFRADAVWYIALSFLQEKNTVRCLESLRELAPGDAHYEQAQELAGKLR
jgi:tetratricopeptide (TPR) repeat protein